MEQKKVGFGIIGLGSVSYTHLDVYKRQDADHPGGYDRGGDS